MSIEQPSLPKVGYLLPTRERVMAGSPDTAALLELAEKAEALGYDSVWVGDSLLARPRHEPLTLLAGVAARTRRVALGTAVLLPALRNPVLLAHQVATLDRIAEGRLILGVGVATDVERVRDEFEAAGVPFEKRAGRMLEGLRLCRALWSGEPIDWQGRWRVKRGVLGPTPHRPGGPPVWIGGSVRASLERAGRHFDGWFPTGPDAARWGEQWRDVQQVARRPGERPAPSPARSTSPSRSTTTKRRETPGSTGTWSNTTAHRRLRCAGAKPASRARRTRPRAGSGATPRPARVISCSASSGITMPCSRRWPGSVPISVGQAPGGSPFRTGASLQRPRTRPPPADTKTSLPATATPFT